ncbi:MAG: exodeoxyribonuclease V subunit gamma, partial [Proteobacteria bacterium]|nr:exodeoxyribonuclease V subunit gamma [Pseudomonadota bacterium]
LLGMNEQEFPRLAKPLSFDLIAKNPRLGDRSQKDDDRYLFLEAVLSAKDTLYISFIGRNIKDNTLIPPSALVSELLYYIEQGFYSEKGGIGDHILTRHHLQAFNPNYFKSEPPLISYSETNLQAARTLADRNEDGMPAFVTLLPEPSDEWKTVEIDQLVDFFDNPAKYLIRRRLGVVLGDDSAAPEESEPFVLNNLERYIIKQELVEGELEAKGSEEIERKLKAAGVLPLKAVGRITFKSLLEETEKFVDVVNSYTTAKRLESLPVDFELSGFRIRGTIASVWPNGLIHFRSALVKPKDRIRNWLELLILNHLNSPSYPRNGILIGFKNKDKIVALASKPVENPEEYLSRLLGYYWDGLSKPLPFFPKSSEKYVQTLLGKKPDTALEQAEKTYKGYRGSGEMNDSYLAKCFSGRDPLDGRFTEVSENVLRPILEHQVEI